MFSKGNLLFGTLLLIICTYKKVLCSTNSACPDSTELSPYCVCYYYPFDETNLDCSDAENEDDLELVFSTAYFPTTNINDFILKGKNRNLKNLTRNVFGDITFDRVFLSGDVLEYIDETVFAGSFFTLTDLYISKANFVPQGFPFSSLDQYTSLITLDISHGGTIDVVPKLVSNSIQELTLYDNNIGYLQDQVFDGLPKLRELDLRSNDLTSESLPSVIFKNNPKLQLLTLDGNKISVIETGTFKDLLQLGSVSINTNHITEIKAGAFYNLPSLGSLSLIYNKLSVLNNGSLALLPNLDNFYASYNIIQFIDPEFFSDSPSVSYVEFQNNNLSSIMPGTFNVMDGSSGLLLFRNQLTTLEEDWLKPVLLNGVSVSAVQNPLDCGCDLAWLYTDVSLMRHLFAECSNGTDIHDLDPLYFASNC